MKKVFIFPFRGIKKISLLIIFLVFSLLSFSQERISGVVVDSETGDPLTSVTIGVKGTDQGTFTDVDGQFEFQASPQDSLVLSSVGYISKTEGINGRTNLEIRLVSSNQQLTQLVVVGYGVEKKATITGAITTIKGRDVEKSPAPNISNSLAGRLPGLVAVTRTGQPGNDNSTLRIRGQNTLGDNSPLVVIDGIKGRDLNRLNPSDIEDITVLKDASAAIYGSEAANGVILITTKRGKTGKPIISLDFNQGWNQPTVLPKMADAPSYAQMLNEIDMYAGNTPRYTEEDIELFKDGSDPWGHPNTDWFKETIKNWSPQTNASLAVSGGSENVRYYVSGGYLYQDGIFKKSATNYRQGNFRANIDAKISNVFNLRVDLSARQESRHYPGIHDVGGALNVWWGLNRQYPYLPAYWPNGLPGPDVEYGSNPVVTTTRETGYTRDITYSVQGNVQLDVNIPWVEGWTVTGNISYDRGINNFKRFLTPWYLYTWDGVSTGADGLPELERALRGPSNDPQLWQSMGDSRNNVYRVTSNYIHSFNERHNIGILVGAEGNDGTGMNFDAFRRFFPSTEIDQMFAGGDELKNNGGSANHFGKMSFFGRINYDYKNKYLLEFLFRADGSYIFPKDQRYGYFPGVSIGWRVSEEDFWNDNFSINDFKIRGSWGQTGNDRVPEYQYLAAYGFGTPYIFNENVSAPTTSLTRTPNPNITWEVANQTNVGVDLLMFNSKMNFTAEYFHNVRSDILWQRNATVPASAGLTLPQENFAKVQNSGFELQVGYQNSVNDLTYGVSVNAAYAKNKILDWDEPEGVPEYQKSTGHPMGSDLYYEAIGIFRDQKAVDDYPHWDGARPGDIIFKDVNGDGIISGLDRVRQYKSDIPTWTGGGSVQLGYKGFDLSAFFQGAAGAVRTFVEFSGEAGNFRMDNVIGRWTPDNPDAKKPRAWNRTAEYWSSDGLPNNTYWLRRSDYLRLKNLEIGYTFPSRWFQNAKIQNLRVYISGMNLVTFTEMIDFDPESPKGQAEDTPDNIWVNSEVYPPNKTLNVGLNLTF